MVEQNFYNNQFLVAMPNVVRGDFDHTVTFLCEHSEDGAMGLVINRPTDLSLADMLAHMELDTSGLEQSNLPVYWGGPVQPERGFVLHSPGGDWDSSMQINDELHITTSKDILEAIGRGKGPEKFLVTLGYAGWGGGQLEEEILHNSWLNAPADNAIIFSTPSGNRWAEAAKLLGVDPSLLSGQAGHA